MSTHIHWKKIGVWGAVLYALLSVWALRGAPEEPLAPAPTNPETFATFVVQALDLDHGGTFTVGERAALVSHAARAVQEGWWAEAVEELNDHVVGAYTAISELMRQWEAAERRERGVFAGVKGVVRRLWFQSPRPIPLTPVGGNPLNGTPVRVTPAGREEFLRLAFTAPRLTPYAARTLVRALNVAEMGNSEDPGRWPTAAFSPFVDAASGRITLHRELQPLALAALKKSPALKDAAQERARQQLIAVLEQSGLKK